jgi:NAD-dependent deacetylase
MTHTAPFTEAQYCIAEGCERINNWSCRGCGDPICDEHGHHGGGVDDVFCPPCSGPVKEREKEREIKRRNNHVAGLIPDGRWAKAKRAFETGNVLVITGAGVSAESGIPTFRSADGTGIYESDDWNPLEFLRSETVENQIDKLWEYYLQRFTSAMNGAKPNAAHDAIAGLELGKEKGTFGVITQNIDGLHREAGSQNLIELHGNKQMRCSDECWLRNNNEVPKLADIPENAEFPEDLTCPDCGYMMRPHVLLFDEHYTQELYRYDEANAWADEAHLVITVGCSAVVPIAQLLANLAVQHDAMVIDVNPGEGPLSNLAEQTGIWLQAEAGAVMPKLADYLIG